jgi:hypothetical protein
MTKKLWKILKNKLSVEANFGRNSYGNFYERLCIFCSLQGVVYIYNFVKNENKKDEK